MCGIAGIVGEFSSDGERRGLQLMLDAQRHRGPEAQRILGNGRALFGQCALEFVDIGRSQQPYRSLSGRYLVVFNGELYNHRELRKRIQALQFTQELPPGEAPLIAERFAMVGLAMVRELEGMFAIAIYDAVRDETTLIRDRFGEKPLYYARTSQHLIFTSELKAIAAHPLCSLDLCRPAIGLYMTFGAVPAPHTLLESVQKVPPGSAVTVGRDGISIQCCLPVRFSPLRRPLGAAHVLSTLQRAVVARIPTETSFGIFLSGGLDSSLIAALTSRHVGPVSTYSLGFDDAPTFDETRQAEAVAKHLGTRHTVVTATRRQIAEETPRALSSIDEPVTDQSLVPTILLSRAARAEVKAVLTGDGADELFMGYNFFPVSRIIDGLLTALPGSTLRSVLRWLGNLPARDTNLHFAHVAAHLSRTIGVAPERRFVVGGAALERSHWPALMHQDTWATLQTVNEFDLLDHFMGQQPDLDSAERLQAGMIRHFLCDVVLTKLDRATMRESLEARCPFLDHEVVDTALALPRQAKLRAHRTKHILRTCASGLLPTRIVRGLKRGFRTPTASLLKRELRHYMTDMLSPDCVRSARVWRPEAVEKIIHEHLSGTRDHHRALWSMTCFSAWLRSLGRTS